VKFSPENLAFPAGTAGISRGHGSTDGGRGQPTLRNCLGTRGQQRFQGGAARAFVLGLKQQQKGGEHGI